MKPLVTLKDISLKKNDTVILNNINLEIFPNELVTLIGLNGAGKTTLLEIMLGIQKPTKGKVILGTKKIGYVPQRLQFDTTIPFSVKELLQTYSGKTNKEILNKLEEVGATKLFEKSVGKLSGGELQRVLIANALLQESELLLLDEATSGIDVSGEQHFYKLIEKLFSKYKITIIMVSHDIHMVFAKSTKVYCLNKCLCCHGSPKDVSINPEFTKIFGNYLAPYHHEPHKHNH